MDKEIYRMDLQLFGSTPSSNSPVWTGGIDRDRRELDVSKVIADLIPDASPFAVLLMKVKKERVGSNYFYWYDQKPGSWWTEVVSESAVSASETEIPVADASIFRPKDLVKVTATEEVLFVEAIDETEGANTITVKRAYGETAAAEIPVDANLMRQGNAMEEFSRAPEAKIVQPFKGWNVCQTFRTPFDQSETSSNEDLKTIKSERNRLTQLKGLEHRLDMERAMIFGERYEDPDAKRSTTGGLLSFIKDHFVDAQDKFCEGLFEEYCQELFTYGSGTKLLIASRSVLSLINQFARDRIETTSREDTYGIRMKRYISTHGDLLLVPSMTLERDYGTMAIGIDVDNIKYRVHRDTRLIKNIQLPDEDGWRDEYLSSAGLEVRLPQTHCVLYNATTKELTT